MVNFKWDLTKNILGESISTIILNLFVIYCWDPIILEEEDE